MAHAFDYSASLDPVDKKMRVTVTYKAQTTKSQYLYSTDTGPEFPASASYEVTYLSPCTIGANNVITATTQSGVTTITDAFSEASQSFDYTSYTIEPSLCTLRIDCQKIEHNSRGETHGFTCANHAVVTGKIVVGPLGQTQYESDNYFPGTYTFSYAITTQGNIDGSNILTQTYTLTLQDACKVGTITKESGSKSA